ncbi:MAG: hypothetical protein AAF420_12910, partial [Pseudomonadota bacterium]
MDCITGYAAQITRKAGETIEFMLSGEGVSEADAHIVKLIHGDENPKGPGFLEKEIDASCNGRIALEKQHMQTGAFVEFDKLGEGLTIDGSFTLYAYVWPSAPGKGTQTVLGRYSVSEQAGFALEIGENGKACFILANGAEERRCETAKPLRTHVWYFLAASYDAERNKMRIVQRQVANYYNSLLSPMIVVEDDDANEGDGVAPTNLRKA